MLPLITMHFVGKIKCLIIPNHNTVSRKTAIIKIKLINMHVSQQLGTQLNVRSSLSCELHDTANVIASIQCVCVVVNAL